MAVDHFYEPVEIDKGMGFESLHKHWFEFVRIASPDATADIRGYLEGLVQDALALDDVHIKKVRVLISDEDDQNAMVINDDSDDAVIGITRGLLNSVESEDELLGVLLHELGHVEIRTRIGCGNNSRPEEIGADGFAAWWMVQTGRNWRALQRFFKKLSGIEKKREDRLSKAEKAKHQITDVHSTALDRVHHMQTAVGILAIKRQRAIHEPAERPLPEWIRERAKSVKHFSYIDLLLKQNNFFQMPVRQKLEFLCDLDRRHYGWSFIPKDKRGTKETELFKAAREARREDFQRSILAALSELQKDNQGHYSSSDMLLLERVIDTAGLYHEAAPVIENVEVQLVDLRVYKKVNELLGGDQKKWLPLGSYLKPLEHQLSSFVTAKDGKGALSSAQVLKDEISRHEALDLPVGVIERDTHLLLPVALLYRKIAFPNFSGPVQEGHPLPWQTFVEWAKADETGIITEMLWRIGVNNDEELWRIMHPTVLRQRRKQWNFTQPDGQLEHYSFSVYNSGKANRKGITVVSVVDREKHEAFKLYADNELKKYHYAEALVVPEFHPGRLKSQLSKFFLQNEALLAAPSTNKDGSEHFKKPDYDAKKLSIHDERILALLDRIKACLQEGRPNDREAIRDFLMDGFTYSNVLVPCLNWIAKDWKLSYPWESPLIGFVAEDQFNLFSFRERADILLAFTLTSAGLYSDKQPSEEVDLPYWRQTFAYSPPESFAQLIALAKEIDIFSDPTSGKSYNNTEPSDEGGKIRTQAKLKLIAKEIENYFDQKKPPMFTSDFAELAAFYIECMKAKVYIHPPKSRLQTLIRDDAGKAIPVYFVDSETGLSPNKMVDIYTLFDTQALFPNLKYKTDFSAKILEQIAAVKDVDERYRLYECLVFTNERGLRFPLTDFVLTEKSAAEWAKCIAELHGQDTGSEVYYEKLKPVLDRIKDGVPERDRKNVFRVLADAVVAQRAVSFNMARQTEVDRKAFVAADIPVRGVEKLLDYMRQSKEHRNDALDFFTQPENDAAVEAVSDKFIAWLDADTEWRKAPFMYELGILPITASEEDLKSLELNLKLKDRVHGIARELHRFFWSRNLDIRTLFLNYILVTPQELADDPATAHKEALGLTLDKLFSEETACHKEKLRNLWSREFLEVYLENAHESERSLILSAIISSAQTSNVTGVSQAFGERLANILGMLGPAYYKLGQAIHSHPQTPDDIRGPMAKLKSMGEKPARWDYIARIDRQVPRAIRDQFAWIGDIVGRASFFTTGPVHMADGNKYMLGLLEENAASKAKHGFDRLEACAKALARRNADFAPFSHTIISMIRQARDLVEVETNLHEGAKQSMHMQEQYGGLSVAVDGHTFRYDPKIWRYYGDQFKLMDIAAGVHFDELPSDTPEQVAYIKAAAKANSTVGLMHIVSGKRFDNDWHERQMRLQGEIIGLFDPGGILLDEPTAEDKMHLVKALKICLPAVTSGTGHANSAANALINYLAKIEGQTGSCPAYLLNVQKALLAQSGFHRCLEQRDFKDIVMTLVKGNYIDPVIRKSLAFQLAGLSLVQNLTHSLDRKLPLTIQKTDDVEIFCPAHISMSKTASCNHETPERSEMPITKSTCLRKLAA